MTDNAQARQRKVAVPIVDAEPREGTIIGREWEPLLGEHVWIVEFSHGHTARLTEREVVHAA